MWLLLGYGVCVHAGRLFLKNMKTAEKTAEDTDNTPIRRDAMIWPLWYIRRGLAPIGQNRNMHWWEDYGRKAWIKKKDIGPLYDWRPEIGHIR